METNKIKMTYLLGEAEERELPLTGAHVGVEWRVRTL